MAVAVMEEEKEEEEEEKEEEERGLRLTEKSTTMNKKVVCVCVQCARVYVCAFACV